MSVGADSEARLPERTTSYILNLSLEPKWIQNESNHFAEQLRLTEFLPSRLSTNTAASELVLSLQVRG